MEPDFEPLFLSMALYDAKEKRKISENFYLDMNSDLMKRMLQNHVPYADMSTLARSCIFNVSSHSAQDIFLVIRVSELFSRKRPHNCLAIRVKIFHHCTMCVCFFVSHVEKTPPPGGKSSPG